MTSYTFLHMQNLACLLNYKRKLPYQLRLKLKITKLIDYATFAGTGGYGIILWGQGYLI